jgi:hypothetical protein
MPGGLMGGGDTGFGAGTYVPGLGAVAGTVGEDWVCNGEGVPVPGPSGTGFDDGFGETGAADMPGWTANFMF